MPTKNNKDSSDIEADSQIKANISHLTPDQRGQLYFNILLGDLALREKLLDVSQSNYLDAAEKTKSPQLAKKASTIALRKRDYISAQQAADIWRLADNSAAGPHKVALINALQADHKETAIAQLALLIERLPNSPDKQLIELSQVTNFYKSSIDNRSTVADILAAIPDEETGFNQQEADLISLLNSFNQNQASAASLATEALIRLQNKNSQQHLPVIHMLLDQSLSLVPSFVGAIELKAEAYGQESESLKKEYLKSILKHNVLKDEQLMTFANIAYNQKNYSTAIISYKRILELDSSNLLAQYSLAGSYYATEEYKKAATLFWQLANLDYRHEVTSYYCADSAQRVDDYVKATACYQMVSVGHYFYRSRVQLAHLLAQKNQFQEAINSLQQAQSMVDFNEKQRLIQFEINFFIEHKQYANAQRRINESFRVQPDSPTTYYLQMQLVSKTESLDILIQTIERLLDKASDLALHKEVAFMGSEILQSQNNYLQAYQLLSRESQRHPQDLDLLYTKALAGEPLGYYQQLETDLRALLTRDPNYNDARNALGYTLADLNRSLPEALSLIEAAYATDPENPAIQDSMGWIHYRLGNLQRALKYLLLSYKNTQAVEVAAHLGEVLWKLNQPEKARFIWRKALQQSPTNAYILNTLKRFPEANIIP